MEFYTVSDAYIAWLKSIDNRVPVDVLPALKGGDSCFAEPNLSRIKRFRDYRLSTS